MLVLPFLQNLSVTIQPQPMQKMKCLLYPVWDSLTAAVGFNLAYKITKPQNHNTMNCIRTKYAIFLNQSQAANVEVSE